MASTFHWKPIAACREAFRADFSSSLRARSNLGSLMSQHMWGSMKIPTLIFLLSLGNFLHKNKNARPFLSRVLVEFFMRSNLICRGGIYEGWWAMSFAPGVWDLCWGQFFSCSEHFWHNYSIHVGNNRILFDRLQCHPNGSNLKITADRPLMFLVVHAAENFLHVFVCSLFVDSIGNEWKVVHFLWRHCF